MPCGAFDTDVPSHLPTSTDPKSASGSIQLHPALIPPACPPHSLEVATSSTSIFSSSSSPITSPSCNTSPGLSTSPMCPPGGIFSSRFSLASCFSPSTSITCAVNSPNVVSPLSPTPISMQGPNPSMSTTPPTTACMPAETVSSSAVVAAAAWISAAAAAAAAAVGGRPATMSSSFSSPSSSSCSPVPSLSFSRGLILLESNGRASSMVNRINNISGPLTTTAQLQDCRLFSTDHSPIPAAASISGLTMPSVTPTTSSSSPALESSIRTGSYIDTDTGVPADSNMTTATITAASLMAVQTFGSSGPISLSPSTVVSVSPTVSTEAQQVIPVSPSLSFIPATGTSSSSSHSVDSRQLTSTLVSTFPHFVKYSVRKALRTIIEGKCFCTDMGFYKKVDFEVSKVSRIYFLESAFLRN
ncbi:unnamed protein product [Protopolystoma xenopodis]|uniref:Uncharacterized protein n=1 Tax=Protopolystoma xenopodis TaxID=117903 RepID=A0A448WFK3_9PLAT|nr:unnamed protein product [Protopolystoma xenopodis]